ncbi:MAG: hypothetical protein KDA68_17810, partial [Planctomycetaceae bacterium]|nr:hypothetical protein [Planctomycetaceae bacterium]
FAMMATETGLYSGRLRISSNCSVKPESGMHHHFCVLKSLPDGEGVIGAPTDGAIIVRQWVANPID